MLKKVRKIILVVLRSIKWILIVLFGYILFNYLTCPIYDFPDPEPFAGEYWYNPYQDIDTFKWRKSNFQIQSRAWLGLTGGSNNLNEDIDSVYSRLGYDIITISDYMKINRFGQEKPEYIPVYEHGYGIRKWHQVVIGASRINWRDYPFFQTIHNKQHIVKILKQNNDLVYIAHPRLRRGFSPDDFMKLTGFDGIEVLNYMRVSMEHWDAALSSGRYATVIGNDDAHDIREPLEIGHRCTFVHADTLNRETVIISLQKGLAYAADIHRTADDSWEDKFAAAGRIAKLRALKIYQDTLQVETDGEALEFRFIGQSGRILMRQPGGSTASYKLKPNDTYVRTEITYFDKNILYLNPVVRYNGTTPGISQHATVNLFRTWMFRIISWIVVLLGLGFYIRRRINKVRN